MNKFKVGDRVEIVAGGDNKARFIGTFFTIDSEEGEMDGEQCWSGKDNKSPYRYKESELRHVAQSPIRTITRREIVPGEYLDGGLEIFDDGSVIIRDWTAVPLLRSAARIFNEIADVLDEQQEVNA